MQEEKTGLEDLSPREFEIFRMILDARSTDEIAAALNVSRKTVANYHYGIKSKLGVAPISSFSISACGKVSSGPCRRQRSAEARPKHAIAPARAIFPGFPGQVSIFPPSGKHHSPSRM